MAENTAAQPTIIVQKGHQPLATKDGYQPTSALKGGPPQGGSGVPNVASAKSTPSSRQSGN